jgi:hypothetical protein
MFKHAGRGALAIGFCALMSANASAATFAVDKNADDAGGGACLAATPNDCSLRSAIQQANTVAGPDDITLGAGTFAVTTAPQAQVTQAVTITGAGARSTAIDGGGVQTALLEINVDDAVTISDLTVQGAAPSVSFGRAVNVLAAGPLLLSHVALVDNDAIALQNQNGAVQVEFSLVARNTASGAAGIVNTGNSAVMSITGSTIAQNTALPTSPTKPAALSAGVVNSGVMQIADSTIAGNRVAPTATTLGGDNVLDIVLSADPGLMRVRNSIVADPGVNGNCGGPMESAGRNLDSDNTCHFQATGDHPGADPLLAALADNGGPTDTRALPANSPAVDAGAGCAATDQRGVARPAGGACDIGAFESPFTASVATTPPVTPTTPTAPTTTPVASADTAAPSLTVGGIAKTVTRKVFNKGLKVKIGANEPIAVELTLLATPSKVTIAKLPSVALLTKSLPRAGGTRTVTLKPTTKIKGTRKVRMRLIVVAFDAAGNRASKTVAFTVK